MIVAIVPALDEEATIGAVVRATLPHVDQCVVVDNGSSDGTADEARAAGAAVVCEPRRGYGRACLAGARRASELGARVLAFLDADGSDEPDDLPRVLEPVLTGSADLALGARALRWTEPGSMTRPQRFGNWLAPRLMSLLTGAQYSDMPPQKAITLTAFEALDVRDLGHGFTIELMLKAHRLGLSVREVEVHCRPRAGGKSKVSGTVSGTVRASLKIVGAITYYAISARFQARQFRT